MRNIKLQDLFTQLEKYKNDLTYLFTKQLLNEPVSKLSFISDTEKEKMDFILQEYGILVEDDGCIKFDSQSFDYFSDVLNINGNINLAVCCRKKGIRFCMDIYCISIIRMQN